MVLPKDPTKIDSYRKRLSEIITERFKDPSERKKISISKTGNTVVTQETRLRISAAIKQKYATDPNYRSAMSASKKGCTSPMKGKHHSKESIYKMHNSQKKRAQDPIWIEKQRISHIGKHPSQETRLKMSLARRGKRMSLETKQKIGMANSGKKASGITRQLQSNVRRGKRCGSENPSWRGGSSFKRYCPKFNAPLKRNVRNFFGNRCVLCNKTPQENKAELSVHHVFTEKLTCCENKITEMGHIRSILPTQIVSEGETFSDLEIQYIRMMVPLCKYCHGKLHHTNEDVPFDQTTYRKYFVELVLNKYDGNCYTQ